MADVTSAVAFLSCDCTYNFEQHQVSNYRENCKTIKQGRVALHRILHSHSVPTEYWPYSRHYDSGRIVHASTAFASVFSQTVFLVSFYISFCNSFA